MCLCCSLGRQETDRAERPSARRRYSSMAIGVGDGGGITHENAPTTFK